MIVAAVDDPTEPPKFAVYATLPGRGVVTAVGSTDIRMNVVWETVDVPAWDGELYHHVPASESKEYFALTGGAATAAGKWGVLAGVTEDGPAVLWYDFTEDTSGYLQLDPAMSPLSTFAAAPGGIERRLDGHARPAPKPPFDAENLDEWKAVVSKYTPLGYVVKLVQTGTSVAVAVLDDAGLLTVYVFDEAKTHGVTAVVKSVSATAVGTCAAAEKNFGLAHLVGGTVVLVCGGAQVVCDTATDTCGESSFPDVD